MGLEPHLTPPVLYSTHIHTCSADAAWSARGLRQATPTSAQRMHTLADTAGSAETRPEERSPVADRRWASTCTTDRDPQTHDQREGGAGPLGASLGRPPPRRVGRTHALDRRQKSLVEPANRLDTHRVEAEAQPESPRARSEQRRFQAALDDREHAGESLRSGRARRPLDCRSATARHAFGPEGGPTGRSSAWLGGWARADANATRLTERCGRRYATRGGERGESTAGRDRTARACTLWRGGERGATARPISGICTALASAHSGWRMSRDNLQESAERHDRHVCRGGSNIARRAVAAGQGDLGRERFRAGLRGARFRLYWARLPQRRCAWSLAAHR